MRALDYRLAAWYTAAVGTISMVPYLAVILSDTGLSDRAVAATMALLPVGALLGGPLWALYADRTGSPRRVLQVSAAFTALATTLLLGTEQAAWVALALLLYALARAPIFALGDAIVLRVLPGGRSTYGRFRLWGSATYLLLAGLNGWARGTWPRAPLWVTWAFVLATVAAASGLPSPRLPPRPPLRDALKALGARPALLPLLAACTLHGMGLSTYDSLYSLHIDHLGLASWVVGAAVAIGVAAEVTFMALAPRLLGWLSPWTLLVIGLASSIPRWWWTGSAHGAAVQIAVQSLHGLGFGAFWIAGVTLVAEEAPDGLEASTQALFPAAVFGIGSLLSMGTAALALETIGTGTLFHGMSTVSVVATLLALWAARDAPWTHRGGVSQVEDTPAG